MVVHAYYPLAETRVQREAGVTNDSADIFAHDIQAKARGTAAPHLVAAYTGAIAPAMDALQSRHGLAFELLGGFLYPGHSVLRMHTLPQRTGATLVAALDAAAVRAGAMLMSDAWVFELWRDDTGRVIGVGYRRPDGTVERLACRSLLLASNGFGGNRAMVRELLPRG
jgi:fumarate reductase flavoprotein subunit